jgi:hypothetical protein
MRNNSPLVLFFGTLVAILTINGLISAQVKKSAVINVTRTEKMLRDIKANYQPFQGENSFIVLYSGKEKEEISVILIETDDAVLVLADVAAGRTVGLTPEVMRKLLEFNMQADFIKVGISDIGSIRVQSEQGLASIDPKSFGKLLDQIAAGADDVAKILKPVIKTLPAVK